MGKEIEDHRAREEKGKMKRRREKEREGNRNREEGMESRCGKEEVGK